jgi:hypothetical protein
VFLYAISMPFKYEVYICTPLVYHSNLSNERTLRMRISSRMLFRMSLYLVMYVAHPPQAECGPCIAQIICAYVLSLLIRVEHVILEVPS